MGIISRLPWTSDIPFSPFESPSQPFDVHISLPSIDGNHSSESSSTVLYSESVFIYQKGQQNRTLLPDTVSEYYTPSSTRRDQERYANGERTRVSDQVAAMNLHDMDFENPQLFPSIQGSFDSGPSLGFSSNDLQIHASVDRPDFDTYGVTLPDSIKTIDISLFGSLFSLFYEAFGQNWVTS